MSFFNKLLKKDELSNKDVPRNESGYIDRQKISAEKIDQMQRIEASEKYQKKIYKKFYSNYPEKPFISQDREFNTDWINQELVSLVPLKNMTRYADGLLPGHVYMLHWIQSSNKKRRIPSYFEYKYGIEFVQEREFLKERGYLSDDYTITDLGLKAIEKHGEVVQDSKKPKFSRSTPSLELDALKNIGDDESESKRISLFKDLIDLIWEQNYIESTALKTDEERRNHIQSFYEKLMPYEKYMPDECVQYYTGLTIDSYVSQPLRITPLGNDFAALDEDGDYEMWINSYKKHGLDFETWKVKIGNNAKKSNIEKFTLYQNEVKRTSDNYYELMYILKNNWSALIKEKDYNGVLADWFEKDCLFDIFLLNKMIAIDKKYDEAVPKLTSCPAAELLIRLYKRQGRVDEAINICNQMIASNVAENKFTNIVTKLSGGQ